MSAFLCPKLKRQVVESCSGCEDCPGDAEAVQHLATFMYLDAQALTPEMEAEILAEGWEKLSIPLEVV